MSRVCNLLHFDIKPVFVFDGPAPAMKLQTLVNISSLQSDCFIIFQAARRKVREAEDEVLNKASKRILVNHVRQQMLGVDTGPTSLPPRRKDVFELPELQQIEDIEAEVDDADETETERLQFTFVDTAAVDVFSADFDALPLEIQHDIIVELKERQRRKERHSFDTSATKFSSNQASVA
jgi:hypothetical protein